jgi:hypothetical protein
VASNYLPSLDLSAYCEAKKRIEKLKVKSHTSNQVFGTFNSKILESN